MDATLGRVVQALDDARLADNTLLLFTSDNGAHWLPQDIEKWKHRANDGWRGQKADIWDGGHRVPFIARWPGKIQTGSTSAELICLTDHERAHRSRQPFEERVRHAVVRQHARRG